MRSGRAVLHHCPFFFLYSSVSLAVSPLHYKYLEGRKPGDSSRSQYYDPERVAHLENAKKIIEKGRSLIAEHYNSEFRIQTYSVRLLEAHTIFAELLADALIPKAVGNDNLADERYKKMKEITGRFELAFQNCYDHGLAYYSLDKIFTTRTRSNEPIIY